jgi:hypothetical protein
LVQNAVKTGVRAWATGVKAALIIGSAWLSRASQAGVGRSAVVEGGTTANAAVAARHATKCFICGLLSVG